MKKVYYHATKTNKNKNTKGEVQIEKLMSIVNNQYQFADYVSEPPISIQVFKWLWSQLSSDYKFMKESQ